MHINGCLTSGPAESVRQFIEELREEDVFAKEVASAGMAFHSELIEKAVPRMLEELSKVDHEYMYLYF